MKATLFALAMLSQATNAAEAALQIAEEVHTVKKWSLTVTMAEENKNIDAQTVSVSSIRGYQTHDECMKSGSDLAKTLGKSIQNIKMEKRPSIHYGCREEDEALR